MILMPSHIKPQYKTPEKIAAEAVFCLNQFRPGYTNDLNLNLDTYELLDGWLPEYIKNTTGDNFAIEFQNIPENKGSEFLIAGYTEPYQIVLEKDYFDSSDPVKNKIFNWTATHEIYHALYHRPYMIGATSQDDFFITSSGSKIVTLKRDLDKPSNPFCIQANYFAADFLLPKTRLQKVLLEVYGEYPVIVNNLTGNAAEKALEQDMVYRNVARRINGFFETNVQPIEISLRRHNLIKIKDPQVELAL